MNALAATHDAAVQMIDTSIIRVSRLGAGRSHKLRRHHPARKMLHDKGQPHVVLEVIAQNIITDFTMTGDRDPGRLAQRALRTFGIGLSSRWVHPRSMEVIQPDSSK